MELALKLTNRFVLSSKIECKTLFKKELSPLKSPFYLAYPKAQFLDLSVLFMTYINDKPETSTSFETKQFTDDSILFITTVNQADRGFCRKT